MYRGFPDAEDETGDKYDEQALLKKLKIYPGVTNCYATCPSVYSIDAKGDIYKCHRALGRKDFACGNVFHGIEKNQAYSFFCNSDVTYKQCSECKILPICQGGCKINAILFGENAACAPSKAIIEKLILFYKEDLDELAKGGEKDGSSQGSQQERNAESG